MLLWVSMISIANVVLVDLTIDRWSKTPSYVQLADKIIAAIEAGELEPRQKIPSIKVMTEQSGLAMGTVQKAIKKLEREHWVFAVSGRGTFVTSRT